MASPAASYQATDRVIRARLSSYQYNGPHRHHRGALGFDSTYEHWDWRYVIKVNGLTVFYRQGFCHWDKALASLERSLAKVSEALR